MFFKRKNKGLKAIYAMHSIQGFAFSLIGIFIPIYLLTLGYTVSQVLVFFIIYYGSVAIFSFLAIYLANVFNLQKTIIIGLLFLFVYFILLFLLKSISIPLIIIALLGGLKTALYWIPLHILFARNAREESIGSSTGKLFALPQIASMAGPLLGGLIAVAFGFKVLFGIIFLILLISSIPLFSLDSLKTSFAFKMPQGLKLFKKYPKYFFAEIFDNMGEETEAIIWPIFIYLNLVNIASVGVVGSLASFGSILFTFFIGKTSDKYNKKLIIKIGSFLLLIAWILKYFANNEILFYLITIFSGFSIVMLLVPYTSLIYGIAKKDEDTTDEFFVFREIPVAIGRIAILSIALLVVNNIKITFLIAGVSYLYFLFL